MLKIGFLPLYQIEYPSSRYRVFQFLEPLARREVIPTIVEAPQRNFWKRLTYLPRLIRAAFRQDVLYSQKRLFPKPVLALVCRLNPRLIFDLDDAIFLNEHQQGRLNDMLRAAVIVVVGNEYLAEYARTYNERVVVIPSVVDTGLYAPRPEPRHPGDERIIIGWIGSDPNRGDMVGMEPVFNYVADRYGDKVVFRVIARRPLVETIRLRQEFIPWTLTESRAELQKFDIGLMPLPDTTWNRGKCGFKLIQYMAVGAAPVASPVGVNSEIIEDNVSGYLAETTEQWQQRLSRLIEDETTRRLIGQAARQRIEQYYSVEAVLPRLIETLKEGVQIY